MLLDRENDLTRKIIGCCFETHTKLGPGFDEKIYHNALIHTLKKHSLSFETEKRFTIYLNEQRLGYKRLDLVVEHKVIIELKSIKGHLPDIFRQQLISYLKTTKLTVGLLVNFGNARCTVKRYLNDPPIRAIR